ncbi:MAG: hypothetical protein JST86_01760 [Bacteroidetes bacterium]|nr:hypothetical protein [Bacteroidota bacterium]
MKKMILVIAGICSIALLQFCNSSKKITKATPLSFGKDILPIMQNSCTPCHFPPDGRKKPLNTYDAVKANIDDVIARVKLPVSANGFMPFKSKKPPLSDSLIHILEQWKAQNMPE